MREGGDCEGTGGRWTSLWVLLVPTGKGVPSDPPVSLQRKSIRSFYSYLNLKQPDRLRTQQSDEDTSNVQLSS